MHWGSYLGLCRALCSSKATIFNIRSRPTVQSKHQHSILASHTSDFMAQSLITPQSGTIFSSRRRSRLAEKSHKEIAALRSSTHAAIRDLEMAASLDKDKSGVPVGRFKHDLLFINSHSSFDLVRGERHLGATRPEQVRKKQHRRLLHESTY
jgi:hypothetical protein